MTKAPSYWFKRRRYGWGYTPVTWQGWLLCIVFVASVVVYSRLVTPEPTVGQILLYSFFLVVITLAFIFLTFAKGPRPHWRWGKKPTDDPREDF